MRVVHQSRRSAQRGFTLLELLIATAVGAVVLLVVQTTYFGALRLHNTTHARLEEDLVIQRALGAGGLNHRAAARGRPEEAIDCFLRTKMDVLVLENCVLLKADQKPLEGDSDWKKEFELD